MSFIQSVPSKDNKVEDAFSSNFLENEDKGIVVLELFTSQGCSSCPPADILLNEVKNEYPENVFVLSYHVDYWNYIGWADPFSKKEFTDKQSNYNRKFNYPGNYTPQLVVNGKEHFVGSNRAKVKGSIDKYSGYKVVNELIFRELNREGAKINFNYEIIGKTDNNTVRAILLLNERVTKVKRGENRQRTLTNSNIVIAEKEINIVNKRASGFIRIPDSVKRDEKVTLMLLVENEKSDIIGAVKTTI